MTPKKVIIVSHFFPPKKAIATVRITNIANYLVRHGFEVLGITIDNEKYRGEDDYDMDERVDLYRIPSPKEELEDKILINKSEPKKRVDKNIHLLLPQNWAYLSHLISNKIKLKYLKYYPLNIYWGPGGRHYIKEALSKVENELKNISKDTEVVVITSYSHFIDMYIGYLIKKKYPFVKWIADFRDPQVNPDDKSLMAKYQHAINKKFFSKADYLTSVSKGVKENIKEYNSQSIVLRNTFEEDKIITDDNTNKTFDIVYTGQLYGNRRNPKALMESLQQLIQQGVIDSKDVRLIYAGPNAPVWESYLKEYGLDDIAVTYENLSNSKATKMQEDANILLLLSWSNRNQKGVLTGKIYEYIATRNPILAIVNGDKDQEFVDVFRDLPHSHLSFPEQGDTGIQNFISSTYQKWKEQGKSNKMSTEAAEKFAISNAFKPLLEILK